MKHTLRFRAYLPDDVASEAWRHIDILRQIRNHAVRDYYNSDYNDRPSEYDQHDKLTAWTDRWPTFGDPSQHAAQQAISQIHDDLETLQERRSEGYDIGRLQWQGKGEFRSVSYNQSSRFNVDYNTGDDQFVRLRLEKIGWFKIRADRDVPPADDIDAVILKKETTGEWYVSLVTTVDETPEKPPLSEVEPEDCVGVDLGITSYIHTSDNLSVDTLDLSDEYDRYAREQRKLARKEHGSANWEKQRQSVARAKRTIKRKVRDFQHKLTTWLVTEYDVVAVEDLDVKPLLETSQNAKNKQDAAWSRFLELLEYKADLHGTHVEKVEPAGTTKECAVCGVETAKPIWVREHSCPACGHTEDRDLNAAKNILARGLKRLGAGRSESTPVQTALPTLTPHREAVSAKRVVEAGSPGLDPGRVHDHETGSEWKQSLARGIAGEHEGTELTVLPSSVTTYRILQREYEDARVLAQPGGESEAASADDDPEPVEYDDDPYRSYFEGDGFGLAARRDTGDGREFPLDWLDPKTVVLGIEHDGDALGFPRPEVEAAGGVATGTVGGVDVVVFATDDGLHSYRDPGFEWKSVRAGFRGGDALWNGATGETVDEPAAHSGEAYRQREPLERLSAVRLFAYGWVDNHGTEAFYRS